MSSFNQSYHLGWTSKWIPIRCLPLVESNCLLQSSVHYRPMPTPMSNASDMTSMCATKQIYNYSKFWIKLHIVHGLCNNSAICMLFAPNSWFFFENHGRLSFTSNCEILRNNDSNPWVSISSNYSSYWFLNETTFFIISI